MIKFQPKDGYERLAFAEVLVPDTLNVYGDYHTKESVRQFAYGFAINGFGIDRDHNNEDISGAVRIVEYFIASDNDERFTPGSWVVGIYVLDDQVWDDILSGKINGYSYEAMVATLGIDIVVDDFGQVKGITYPDVDGTHSHTYWALLDGDGRVIVGGTTQAEDGHSHTISGHTYTDFDGAETHRHRFDVLRSIEAMQHEDHSQA